MDDFALFCILIQGAPDPGCQTGAAGRELPAPGQAPLAAAEQAGPARPSGALCRRGGHGAGAHRPRTSSPQLHGERRSQCCVDCFQPGESPEDSIDLRMMDSGEIIGPNN